MRGATNQPDVETVARLFDYIDRLEPGAIGTVLVGEQGANGVILVEDRNVCWAATPELGRRLSDLLLDRASGKLDRPTLESVVRDCRHTGVPFGQALVDRGFLANDALEKALLTHTTESIIALASREAPLSWSPRVRGFSPRHRFPTVSLITSVGCQVMACSPPDLGWLVQPGVAGAAFALSDFSRCTAPLAQVGLESLRAAELMQLCSWARGALDATAEVDSGRKIVVLGDRYSRVAIAWVQKADDPHNGEAPHRSILGVALCPHGPLMSRILSRLMTKGS